MEIEMERVLQQPHHQESLTEEEILKGQSQFQTDTQIKPFHSHAQPPPRPPPPRCPPLPSEAALKASAPKVRVTKVHGYI